MQAQQVRGQAEGRHEPTEPNEDASGAAGIPSRRKDHNRLYVVLVHTSR